MDVIFRKATLEDVESIINLCNECFEENTNIADAKKIFRETESDVNNIYLVGEWQKKLVAHAKITVVKTMYEKMGTYAILNHVCVAPSLRRKKIATKMLDEISKMCQKKECKTIEMWSKNFRTAAHACYLKYGFKKEAAGYFTKSL